MAKKKVEEVSQSKEDKSLEKESKRLRELAHSHGLLSEEKAVVAKPLRPKLAPVAGGKFGDLAHLDSRNPILYIDFPQGRLKLLGTIVYPRNKYITMNFVRGAGSIQCEDLFETMLVFPEAWWIGTKEDNPDELRLEMPLDLQQEKHTVYDFAGGAGERRDPKDDVNILPTQSEPFQATQLESSKLSTPKGQLKMDQWLSQKKSSEKKSSSLEQGTERRFASAWESEEEDDPGFVNLEDTLSRSRQFARTATKKYSYAESSSEEDGTGGSGESNDFCAEPGGKIVKNRFISKDADDDLLVLEPQVSEKEVADPLNRKLATDMTTIINGNDDEKISIIDQFASSQTPGPRGTVGGGMLLSTPVQAGVGFKQSSLSTFFVKPIQKMEAVLGCTPPESNNSKRDSRASSEGKNTPIGAERKGKPPAKRKKTIAEKDIEISDDSDVG